MLDSSPTIRTPHPNAPAKSPTVSRLFQGGTIVCLGTGESLTQADVDYVRNRATAVIAVNDAYQLAPWADVLHASDAKWWGWHPEALGFAGLKFAVSEAAGTLPGVQVLRNTGEIGLEHDPRGLRNGRTSGYQAINLAVHLGASRIILLGYDMQGNHFFGSHPDNSRPQFVKALRAFQTLPEPLCQLGVTVLNCSRATALNAFPCVPLEEALP